MPHPVLTYLGSWFAVRIRFDRNELAGSFGDIGTSLPLIVGIILASGADSASVLICFGLLQITTAVLYGIPMPVQPLKAVAVLVIAQQLSPPIIHGAGFAIGVVMLFLTVSGAIGWLGRVVPQAVIRGIQFGLGLQLATLALSTYITSDGSEGYILAGIGFLLTIAFIKNRRYPGALILVGFGVLYAVMFRWNGQPIVPTLAFPLLQTPSTAEVWQGFILLALPQIPLSLGNSLLATRKLANDFFPDKNIQLTKIGFTYSLMNIASPFFGGLPVCHGSGGLAGHYAFGARTGGSVLISGAGYLFVGLFFADGFTHLVHGFPLAILGVILFVEALTLMKLLRETAAIPLDFAIAILVGVLAMGVPYGYLIGMVVGSLLTRVADRWGIGR